MSIIKGETGVSDADFGTVITEIDGMRLKRPFRVYQFTYTDSEILASAHEETASIGKKVGLAEGMAEGTVQERLTLTADESALFGRLVSEAEDMAGDVLLPYMAEWWDCYVKGSGSVTYVVKKDVGTRGNSMKMVDERLKRMIVKYVVWRWMEDAYPARAEMCRVEYEEAKDGVKRAIGARAFVTPQGRPY